MGDGVEEEVVEVVGEGVGVDDGGGGGGFAGACFYLWGAVFASAVFLVEGGHGEDAGCERLVDVEGVAE